MDIPPRYDTRIDGLLLRAVAFAADKHRNQRRKDAEKGSGTLFTT